MLKCKIKSIKSIGKQKTYNVTMKSSQHNYAIYDEKTKNKIITSNSHSAAYAFLAYQTCWLKRYYPLEFMCNLLTSEINNNDQNAKLTQYIYAAKRMKIEFLSVDVNYSGLAFKIQKLKDGRECIRQPLTMLSGVGAKAVNSIVAAQPYKGLEDFMKRTESRVVNSRVFSTLVENHCLSNFSKMSRDELMTKYEEFKKIIEKEEKQKKKQKKMLDTYKSGSLWSDNEEFDFNGANLQI